MIAITIQIGRWRQGIRAGITDGPVRDSLDASDEGCFLELTLGCAPDEAEIVLADLHDRLRPHLGAPSHWHWCPAWELVLGAPIEHTDDETKAFLLVGAAENARWRTGPARLEIRRRIERVLRAEVQS